MDNCSSFLRSLTSCVPRRSENISKEFWIPDASCRVCYECDTEFTLFNRRHHCRQCGRIFCWACTKNSIPSWSSPINHTSITDIRSLDSPENTERLRVCNYCFNQWKNEIENKSKIMSPDSMDNDRLDGTIGHDMNDNNEHSIISESLIDLNEEREIFSTARFRSDLMTRSDNEDEMYSDRSQSSYNRHFGSNSYYPCSDISDTSPSRDEIKFTDEFSSTLEEKQDNESDTNSSFNDYTPTSSLYKIKTSRNILDFHSNLSMWVPPEPENPEEDKDQEEIYDQLLSFSSQKSDDYPIESDRDSNGDQEDAMNNFDEDNLRLVLFQLLQNEGVETDFDDGIISWVDIVEALVRNVTFVVKSDTGNRAGRVDPIGYIKIKCIASGNRDESMIVNGIVCKKNMAHRRMATRLENPKILILGGCLEYQRVLTSLSSIDTLLQQEREHIKMAIMKIEAQKPDVLLVEKTVARFARDFLLYKDIPLVLNIKMPLLEHIALCTGATIASSIDQLSHTQTGTCELFHVDKFIEEHECPDQRNKMPIKHMLFLEGCPHPESYTILLKGDSLAILKKVKRVVRVAICLANDSVERSFVKGEQASLHVSALKAPIIIPPSDIALSTNSSIYAIPGFPSNREKYSCNPYLPQVHQEVVTISSPNNKGYSKNGDSEDDLGERDNRNVVVSLSTQCIWKRRICGTFEVFRIKYNENFEKSLEQNLRENLFDQNHLCRFCGLPPEAHSRCYTHQNGTVTVSMSRLPDFILPGENEKTIWTWHRCLKCPQENGFPSTNKRVVLSSDIKILSFGRSLELSFTDNDAVKRVAKCGHNIHKDCIRYYGMGSLVASMHYKPITINNALLPPFKLEFGYPQLHGIEKEAKEFVDRAERLFEEILATLYKISDEKAQIEELEGILRKEKSEFEVSFNNVLRKENKQLDILDINKLMRQLVFFAHLWDRRLVFIANMASNPQNNFKNRSESLKEKNKKSMLFTSISLDEETVSQERSFRSRRTLSDGCNPMQSNDPYDVLNAKWTGKNDPFNIIDNALSSLEDSTGGNRNVGISKPGDLSGWIMLPFLHFYRSLNKKIGIFNCYNPFHAYTPVYFNSPEYLGGDRGPRFYAPIGVDEIVVPLFDDEPTSIIAYALTSYDYHNQLSNNDSECSSRFDTSTSNILLPRPQGKIFAEPSRRPHLVINCVDDGPLGKMKYSVTCYYAKYFGMLRKKCCISEIDFVRSLSRCKKWNAEGGKSNVLFAKSLEERFIVKQVTEVELESFLKFGPTYFKYLSDSISSTSPTCLAKIFGIYQVASNVKGEEYHKIDVLVMENLMFGHNITRSYDLKGSIRSRYNPDTSGKDKVLLDENLIENMPTSPIFVWKKAKNLLERAIWNDTCFLSSINVMDYSLLVGIDEEKHEITMGIIDFLRQYTFDKYLETCLKASGILGGPKNVAPTVISPKEYKVRFRKAMSTYFLVISDD